MAVKLGNGNWAVKEDKLLAYNDNSGLFFNKEFDFSRGTSATYVAKDGFIKTAGIQPNIVNNEDFSELGSELVINGTFDTDSNWSKGTGWSISGGSANCDGTQTGSTNLHNSTDIGIVNNKFYKVVYTISNYVSGSIRIKVGNTGFGVYHTSNGTYTQYLKAVVTTFPRAQFNADANFIGSIDNVSVKQVDPNDYWTLGSDWTVGDNKVIGDDSVTESEQQIFPDNTSRTLRIKYTVTVDSGQVAVYMSGQTKDWKTVSGTYTDTITTTSKTIEFDGRNSDPFSGTITDIIVQEIQTDTPRIDFTNDTKGHLLLEPSRTNLITYSEDFSGWSGYQATSNTTTSPSGSAVLFLDFDDVRMFPTTSISNSTEYTSSVYLKANKVADVKLRNVAEQDTIISLTTDWVRYEVSATSISTSTNSLLIDARFSQGLGASGLEIAVWGAQLEQGSYATSYIPTTGATSTRNADVCNNSGSAQDFNSEEGVLYAEIAALESTSSGSKYIAISDGTYNNRASILFSNGATNQIRCFLRVGGTPQVDKSSSVSDVKDFNKVAFSYKENEFKVFINGSQSGSTDTSGSVWSSGTITKLSLTEINSALGAFNGKVRNVQVFTEALTDEQLQELTS